MFVASHIRHNSGEKGVVLVKEEEEEKKKIIIMMMMIVMTVKVMIIQTKMFHN